MFSLLGKGRPLTGALLFRARKGGGSAWGGWFGVGRDSLRRGRGKGLCAGGGLQRGNLQGAGPAGPPAAGGCAGRPQAAPRLRPQAGAPCGPVLGRICRGKKVMGLQIGGGGGAEGAAAGRPRLRPQAGPSGGRSRRAQPVGFGVAETACGRHFPPLARRPRCGTIGAEPKESEEQPHEKDSEL